MPGVTFEILDVTHGGKKIGNSVVSDAHGHAMIRQDLWGCPSIDLAVHAVAPAGYFNTTPASVSTESDLSYGFAHAR